MKLLDSNLFKKNFNFLCGIMCGILLCGGSVYAASQINANNIIYENDKSGLSSTNVQDALNELNDRSKNWINPYDAGSPEKYTYEDGYFEDLPSIPPSGKRVYLGFYDYSQYGVCLVKDGKENCFRANNWLIESKHILNVFNEEECDIKDSYVSCETQTMGCEVRSDGRVNCFTRSGEDECFTNN